MGLPLVIVVDDDESIRGALRDYLTDWGFRVQCAKGGEELDRLLDGGARPDALVIDIMMPGEDGLTLCRRLCEQFPILILSALGEASDKVLGLEIGAEDYLAKPFEPRELLARLKKIIGRRAERVRSQDRYEVYVFDGWSLDCMAREVLDSNGERLDLTNGEFDLLYAFITHPRRVLSRAQLLQLVHGQFIDLFDRSIDLSVSRLRRKLRNSGGDHLIATIWGEGYKLTVPVRKRGER